MTVDRVSMDLASATLSFGLLPPLSALEIGALWNVSVHFCGAPLRWFLTYQRPAWKTAAPVFERGKSFIERSMGKVSEDKAQIYLYDLGVKGFLQDLDSHENLLRL